MIYSVTKDDFPTKEQCSELFTVKDFNDFEWQFAIVDNGLFLRYVGDSYFSPKHLILNDELTIYNSNCWFIQNKDMDFFFNLTDAIKDFQTQDGFDTISGLINLRYEETKQLTECELTPPQND